MGTIFSSQTGTPFLRGSNVQFNPNLTINDYGDAGVVLNGVTPSQLQSAVGKYPIPGTPTAAFLNPKYLSPGSGANPAYITQNTTPGTVGQRVWIYRPHATYDDISISKNFPITERVRFLFQAEMLNAFNHPVFGPGVANGGTYGNFTNGVSNSGFRSNVLSSSFGIATGPLNPNALPTGGARLMELRANIEFWVLGGESVSVSFWEYRKRRSRFFAATSSFMAGRQRVWILGFANCVTTRISSADLSFLLRVVRRFAAVPELL